MSAQPTVRFSVIGLNHGHVFAMSSELCKAGAELASYCITAPEQPEIVSRFRETYPQAQQVSDPRAIYEDATVQLIVSAAVHNLHPVIGLQAMQHGKDYLSDKPGFTTLDQLEEVRTVQAAAGRFYYVYFGERFGSPATYQAEALVRQGAIGRVVQTVGLGPHRANLPGRPAWFFDRAQHGGTLNDLVCHQIDQFLLFTGSTRAEVVAAQVGNFDHPDYPDFEDFADVTLRGDGGTGYARVDWFTPDGLDTWGDGRLFIMGSEGTIELRKNTDLLGRPGGEHLFLVDRQGMQYIDCQGGDIPFGRQVVTDVLERTETAMTQAHAFLASELSLRAQRDAVRLGHLNAKL